LGKETVLRLAKHKPECVFLGSRSAEKGREAIRDIQSQVPDANVKLLELDLASLVSVAAAAAEFKSQCQKLNILINNGGISGTGPGVTTDGFEIQFGTNYVGHALLTKLLLPTMVKTAAELEVSGSVRIINVSSAAHNHATAPGINFENLDHGNGWTRYAQSKLANILHAKALSKHYPTIKSVSLHPGAVQTPIIGKMNSRFLNILNVLVGWVLLMTVEEGAKTQLWAATAMANVESGVYYHPIGVKSAGSKFAQSKKLEDELWEWTEKELKRLGY